MEGKSTEASANRNTSLLNMKIHTAISKGISSWLNFEVLSGRESLFSESYIANPLGQLLYAMYKGKVISEFIHPILSKYMGKRGRKPSIDFIIKKNEKDIVAAIETKWLSNSNSLVKDIIKDIIRLSILSQFNCNNLFLILAGKKQKYDYLMNTKYIKPHPGSPGSKHLFPIENKSGGIIKLKNPSKFRMKIINDALIEFKGLKVPEIIILNTSGCYPKEANGKEYIVHVWSIKINKDESYFIP